MDDTRFTEEDLLALAGLLGSSRVEVASVPESELVDAVHRLHRVRASIDGALSAVVSVIDARTVWAADGARSPAGWLTARVDQSTTAAKAERSLARALRSKPVVDMSNLVLLCRFHHHAVHEGGHYLTRGPDGATEVTRPDHRPLTVR